MGKGLQEDPHQGQICPIGDTWRHLETFVDRGGRQRASLASTREVVQGGCPALYHTADARIGMSRPQESAEPRLRSPAPGIL